MKSRSGSILLVLFLITSLATQSFLPSQTYSSLQDGGTRVGYNSQTGMVSFIGADPARPIVVRGAQDQGLSQSGRGLAMIEAYAAQFGLRSPRDELSLLKEKSAGGRDISRFQQTYQGVPVLAGEMIVNADERGLLSLSGEISPNLSLDTTPQISAEQAQQSAGQLMAKWYGAPPEKFTVSDPALWIYDPRLLGPVRGRVSLVWRMEARPAEGPAYIRELILVDAQLGGILLHFNQTDTLWRRAASQAEANTPAAALEAPAALAFPALISTYTSNSTTSLPGSFLCDESTPACTGGSDPHADAAHAYAIGTYDMYYNDLNRDSIDDAGMEIISSVHYCDPAECPYENAFWDGNQMAYGDAHGYPLGDDVVAHELTHGVTQYESNLFYYYQSGAINESLSDVFGELYDLDNGLGTDTAGTRWEMGEDVSGLGALRDMSDPTIFSDPDAITHANYYLLPGDNGGVHTNSGVNNKAAFLMVDGGTHNGEIVTALGEAKTMAIYYEVQTSLLTSGADYADLYNALYQACLNLVGGPEGIVAGDCDEVRDATDAVRMNLQPTASPSFNTEAPFCSGANVPVSTFYDSFEGGTGNWTFGVLTGSQRWQSGSPYGDFAHTGTEFLYADDYPSAITDVFVRKTAAVTIPANAYLRFDHAYEFEQTYAPDPIFYWDGGVLEYSTNGGSTWVDAGSKMLENGYDGTIYASWNNPLKGRSGFTGASHGYISTRVNLSTLAGQSVMFRWRMGLDDSGFMWGWWLDDVQIYTCSTQLENDIFIGAPLKATFNLVSNQVSISNYASMLDGPVRVINNNSNNILPSQRVTSGASYNELMGVPPAQFTTEYWFPFYDHGYSSVPGSAMRTWVLIGNPDDSETAEVDVYIGGVLVGSYSIPPGSRVTPRWQGTVDGPVRVLSTNGVNIFASERVFTVPNNSFNETFGYPADQFTTEYWFPWYDSVNMNASIMVGNTSSSLTADVDIYIGPNFMGNYDILPDETLIQSYASTIDGPVRVVATNGVDIVASEAALSGPVGNFTAYNEVMGYPFDQFATEYWFPYYDHGYPSVGGSNMRTWVLVGNPDDTLTADVDIYIAGALQGSYSIPPNSRVTPRWTGLQSGPVQVISDIPVFASERVFTSPSNVFNEMMGYPATQFTFEYWFPWYDSINMTANLIVARP